jgi:hypothetical protein
MSTQIKTQSSKNELSGSDGLHAGTDVLPIETASIAAPMTAVVDRHFSDTSTSPNVVPPLPS